MFEQLHTETTNETLARLGFVAKSLSFGKKAIAHKTRPAVTLFEGTAAQVNRWLRDEMAITTNHSYRGVDGRFYQVRRGGMNRQWHVLSGIESNDLSTIHVGTAIEVEAKMRDYLVMPKPDESIWFVIRMISGHQDQVIEDLRKIGAEIDCEGNPVTVWAKMHPCQYNAVEGWDGVDMIIASSKASS